ncbi:MAG TPA: hypothetical protein VGU64_12375 [Terriglobales bacterium]|nr:hypothetical protein [Terriglobales bacterium]
MPALKSPARKPRWFLIPVRVVLVTFLLSLLTFAVTLLLGMLGIVAGARARGIHPDMRIAYRHIALPSAAVVGAIVLVSSVFMEVRHYRQAKALASIERAS